jgi:thymidylate synthase (FAD)
VLPNAAETKIVVTGNCRAWRHFIELRGSPTADTEIRRLALAVLRILQCESPSLFGDYRIVQSADGESHAETEFQSV